MCAGASARRHRRPGERWRWPAGIHGAPDFTLRADVEAGRLVRVLPEARLSPIALYAAWPGRMEPPAKTRAFIELAKLRLRGPVLASAPGKAKRVSPAKGFPI